MSDPAPRPLALAEAELAVGEQRRAAIGFLAGLAGFMAIGLTGGLLGAPNVVLILCIALAVAWALASVAYMSHHESRWQRAEALLLRADERALLGPTGASESPEPADPRWPDLRALLERIRDLGAGDPRLAEAAHLAETQLRAWLHDELALHASIDAEEALGGVDARDHARRARLQAALQARGEAITHLVAALRDLHAGLALRDAAAAPSLDALAELLNHAQADSEVAAWSAPSGLSPATPTLGAPDVSAARLGHTSGLPEGRGGR
jgi:hypothetical protein